MQPGRNAVPDTMPTASFDWARRLLSRQLDTLRRLASAALRLTQTATPISAGSIDIRKIEKTVLRSGRVWWALRLLDALRDKLSDDLRRLDSGESPEQVLAFEGTDGDETTPTRSECEKGESLRGEPRDREDYDRLPRGFGRDDFTKILERPTDEVIALICRELGLSPDWPRLAEEAWERGDRVPPDCVEGQAPEPERPPSPIRPAEPWPNWERLHREGPGPGPPSPRFV